MEDVWNFWEVFEGHFGSGGEQLGSVWGAYEELYGSIWEPFGEHLGSLWEVFGKSLGSLWESFGKSLGRVWDGARLLLMLVCCRAVHGRCLEFWEAFEEHLGSGGE